MMDSISDVPLIILVVATKYSVEPGAERITQCE